MRILPTSLHEWDQMSDSSTRRPLTDHPPPYLRVGSPRPDEPEAWYDHVLEVVGLDPVVAQSERLLARLYGFTPDTAPSAVIPRQQSIPGVARSSTDLVFRQRRAAALNLAIAKSKVVSGGQTVVMFSYKRLEASPTSGSSTTPYGRRLIPFSGFPVDVSLGELVSLFAQPSVYLAALVLDRSTPESNVSLGSGYVLFDYRSYYEEEVTIATLNGSIYRGQPIQVGLTPLTLVQVQNIPGRLPDQDIIRHFKQFGNVMLLKRSDNPSISVTVICKRRQDAERLILEHHGKEHWKSILVAFCELPKDSWIHGIREVPQQVPPPIIDAQTAAIPTRLQLSDISREDLRQALYPRIRLFEVEHADQVAAQLSANISTVMEMRSLLFHPDYLRLRVEQELHNLDRRCPRQCKLEQLLEQHPSPKVDPLIRKIYVRMIDVHYRDQIDHFLATEDVPAIQQLIPKLRDKYVSEQNHRAILAKMVYRIRALFPEDDEWLLCAKIDEMHLQMPTPHLYRWMNEMWKLLQDEALLRQAVRAAQAELHSHRTEWNAQLRQELYNELASRCKDPTVVYLDILNALAQADDQVMFHDLAKSRNLLNRMLQIRKRQALPTDQQYSALQDELINYIRVQYNSLEYAYEIYQEVLKTINLEEMSQLWSRAPWILYHKVNQATVDLYTRKLLERYPTFPLPDKKVEQSELPVIYRMFVQANLEHAQEMFSGSGSDQARCALQTIYVRFLEEYWTPRVSQLRPTDCAAVVKSMIQDLGLVSLESLPRNDEVLERLEHEVVNYLKDSKKFLVSKLRAKLVGLTEDEGTKIVDTLIEQDPFKSVALVREQYDSGLLEKEILCAHKALIVGNNNNSKAEQQLWLDRLIDVHLGARIRAVMGGSCTVEQAKLILERGRQHLLAFKSEQSVQELVLLDDDLLSSIIGSVEPMIPTKTKPSERPSGGGGSMLSSSPQRLHPRMLQPTPQVPITPTPSWCQSLKKFDQQFFEGGSAPTIISVTSKKEKDRLFGVLKYAVAHTMIDASADGDVKQMITMLLELPSAELQDILSQPATILQSYMQDFHYIRWFSEELKKYLEIIIAEHLPLSREDFEDFDQDYAEQFVSCVEFQHNRLTLTGPKLAEAFSRWNVRNGREAVASQTDPRSGQPPQGGTLAADSLAQTADRTPTTTTNSGTSQDSSAQSPGSNEQ